MGWVTRLLNSGARRARIERDLTDEVAFHREQQVADLQAEGWSAPDARREAQRRVGLSGIWVAQAVEQDTLPWLSTAARELRQAIRGLARRPVLFSTSVVTIALGGGVMLAALTIVDSSLLAPLPFPEADRLVVLRETENGQALGGNPARVADWHRSLSRIRGVAGLYGEHLVLGRGGEARQVHVVRGVGPFADVLRLTAAEGRSFSLQEQLDGAPVVMLTHRGWQRSFGGSRDVPGRPITLRGATYVVIGILPADVNYPPGVDLIVPAGPETQRAPRGGNWLQVVGRLRPGASMEEAEQEARSMARHFAAIHPDHDRGLDVQVLGFQAFETREVRVPLLLLLGAALAVYLVVCVNIGGLLLVRALARDQESAIRAALGAGPWAMVRLPLHEALVVALASLPLALLVAHLSLRWLAGALAADVALLATVAVGPRTVAASAAVLLITVLVLAAWPAWHVATRRSLPHAATHAVTDAPSRRRVRRALVGAQVACSTLLLVIALLFSGSLRAMLERPRGFDSGRVLAVRYDFDWEQPKADIDATARRIIEVAAVTAGVEKVGLVDRFPLQGGTQSTRVQIYGEPAIPSDRPDISVRSATPDYFAALAIPFLAGRPYVDGDAARERSELVVNAAFARQYLGSLDVVGRRIALRWDGVAAEWAEIVGVVGNVRQTFRDDAPPPEVYRPWARTYWPLLHVVVRTDGTPDVLARLRAALQAAITDQPLSTIAPLDSVIDSGSQRARTLTSVMAACAAAAALLAIIGLYGLLASEMLARRREVGIRLALGADAWRLRAWLLRPGVGLIVFGIVAGLAASVPAARALESQLFGVSSGSVRARASATVLLLASGVLAACIPAFRIVGARALAALRYE